MPYAERTTVSVEKTQAELQQVITRFGARKYGSMVDEDMGIAAISFEAHARRVIFRLPLPEPDDFSRATAYEQECRRVWRALLMTVKAKLVSVESGVETFEEAFLPQIMVPGANGQTFGDLATESLDEAYRTNTLPSFLPTRVKSNVMALGDGRSSGS